MAELIFGLHDLEDRMNDSVESIGATEINDRVALFERAHNEDYVGLFGTVVQVNPEWNENPIFEFEQAVAAKMQYVTDFGVAKPQKGGARYDRGLPLARREYADGDTWDSLRVKTVRQLNRELNRVRLADVSTGVDEILAALFYADSWTYKTSEEYKRIRSFPSSITVYPLANGDTETFGTRNGSFVTADHYNGQAAAIADAADPFPAIYERMTSASGSRTPRLVTFFNGATQNTNIRALTAFYPVDTARYINYGSDVTTVSDSIQENLLFGDEVIGVHDVGIPIVRWRALPENYLVTLNLDEPALGMRQLPFPQLQGLYRETGVTRHANEYLNRWRRHIGFGVVNRTGADVLLIGNASYSVPTGYTPMG